MATYDLTQGIPASYEPNDIFNCPYSGNKVTMQMLPGTYKLEVWGAEGGYRSNQTYSGKGGYSIGTISFEEPTTFYIYAGASGRTTGANKLGFNGGGYRASAASAGGDGSDIRIGQDSLYARVIVAGGGGSDGATSKQGMYGGGEVGGSSTQSFTSDSTGCGKGGTQTYSGASASYTIDTQSNTNYRGGFGFGGSGLYASSGYGGAGGGGWYGGSGTSPDGSGDDDRGGGGGSGYIYTSATAGNYPTGCLLNSTYYLTDASMISGNAAMTSPTGASETGHYGDGYIRITVINVEAGTKCNFYEGSTLLKSMYLEAGTLLSTIEVKKACEYQWKNSSGSVITTVPDTKEINLYGTLIRRIPATYDLLTETMPSTFIEGDIVECDYSGAIKTISLHAGYYKFEAWGAQGGNAQNGSIWGYGGYGGYASGIHYKSKTSTYYLCVGRVGTYNNSTSTADGGYNGGGMGYQYCGGGGGATHISQSNGLLSTLSSDLSHLVLVAGGGGGGLAASSAYIGNGGAGGGYVGCNGTYVGTSATYTAYQGTGGSQTEGGCCYSLTSTDASSGKFGQGGRYYTSYGAGGGGGFYGGSGGYQYAAGGGGSSWASPSFIIHPRLIPGNNEKYGKAESGFIRITYLGTTYNYNDIDATTTPKPRLKKNDVIKCPYTGDKIQLILPKGKYMIECYGASGGNTGYSTTNIAAYNHSNGKGGYSHGTVTLSGKTKVYLYVGGKGEDGNATNTETSKGGFNGGGNGGSYYAGAGGGATDVRIGTDDLSHRLIIAGGGGGAAYYTTTPIFGGDGGGSTGIDGTNFYNVTYRCTGGTQTSGGTVTTYNVAGNPGELGQGGKCADATLTNYCTGGGGGGGLYGGAGSGFYNSSSYYFRSGCGGGGGSGFTFTEPVTECSLDNQYALEDAFTCASGYDGNGLIIITVLEVSSNEMYCKIDNEWKLIDALYVMINNDWKEIKEIYTMNSTWKNIV